MRKLKSFLCGRNLNQSFQDVRLLRVLWVVVLTPNLLNVDGASVVTNLTNNAASDFVSLTDHHYGVRGGNRGANEVNATTWVVGGVTDCSQLPPGCSCGSNNRGGYRVSSVVCACRDENEVVNLKESSGSRSQYESLSWEVRKCSKVVIHQNFLSAIFNSEKLKLLLKFSHVPNLVIHEAAFTVTDYGSFSHETTVEFNNCDIDTIPPKAFPSYLSLLKFHNCRIGTLSSRFIQSLSINTISLVNSTILNIQPDAFYQRAMIISLLAQNSTFKVIQRDAVASGIQHLNWTDSSIDRLEEFGLSGLIANVYLARCTFSDIQSGGFSVKAWSTLALLNNTFEKVNHRGIDLTQSETGAGEVQLFGNNWNHVAKDFVVAGMQEKAYAVVKNNTFLQSCACRSTFELLLSPNESKPWFINQTLESSRCSLEEKERNCFQTAENTTREKDFIAYDELGLLCSDEMFMCTSEVNEMHVNPKLPNRLQLLAFFIGAFVLFMIVSLLLTLMVYMVRKQRPRKSHDNDSDLSGDVPRKEFVKSLNPDPYGHPHSHPATTGNQNKMTKTPSMPSRLAFLEDVEMEDKGVQTLPTELSADIIEGLREKLSKPDSFWDAKETIDHLYDLIHVRDQAGISSPPDVTCNDNGGESIVESGSSGHNVSSTDSLKPLVTPRQKVKLQPVVDNRSPNRRSMSTFAQLSPTKSVAVGVGSSPSHSNSHIYSELSAVRRESRLLPSPPDAIPPPLPTSSPPQMLADYTEPRDFQTHIYAELLCAAAASNPDTYYGGGRKPATINANGTGPQGVGQNYASNSITSSVIPNGLSQQKANGNVSKNLNDLNFECNKTLNGCGIGLPSTNIPADPTHSNIPTTNKRPLPLVPPKPGVSTSIAK